MAVPVCSSCAARQAAPADCTKDTVVQPVIEKSRAWQAFSISVMVLSGAPPTVAQTAAEAQARHARERLGMSSVLDTLLHANSMPLLLSTTTLHQVCVQVA